jgi:hypothetical protein
MDSESPNAPRPRLRAELPSILTLLVLLGAALYVLAVFQRFGQERFFTIDEFQFGHATWLVSQGEKPYVDFYEHHFPLSYVLHAPLLPEEGSFGERALALRTLPFAYVVVLALVLAVAGFVATGNAWVALLSVSLPLSFGFSLMSAIDYRADNFAAFLFLACLALLEANRRLASRAVAVACGVLFGVAIFMTQKMAVVAVGTLAILAALSWLRRRTALRVEADGPEDPVLLAKPLWFGGAAAGVVLLVLCAGLAAGILPEAFEITIGHALLHEAHYPQGSVLKYVRPFWRETAASSVALAAGLALAVVFARGRVGFWLVPLGVSAAWTGAMKAQYPYNFVFPCVVAALCAVRGYAAIAERIPLPGRLEAMRPLAYLLPLLIVPDQLGFVADRSGNAYQRHVLDLVERFTDEDDAVIDSAGAALFRPHASYYWQHGDAHRVMFRDYFSGPLVGDYRASRAPLWIWDFRLAKLPPAVLTYFEAHYVRAQGKLYALGFTTPATRDAAASAQIDVVREGDYFVFPLLRQPGEQPGAEGGVPRPSALSIDAEPVLAESVHLDEGLHRVEVGPGSPEYAITLLPIELFERRPSARRASGFQRMSRLFEYGRFPR